MAFGTSPVQVAKGTSTSATPTAAFSVAPTAGNLILLHVSGDAYITNDFAPVGMSIGSKGVLKANHGSYLFYEVSDGSNSFPYILTAAANSSWTLQEFVATNPCLDVSNGQLVNTGAGAYTTPAIVPATGERLLIGAFGGGFGPASDCSGNSITWLNSFTHAVSSGPAAGSGTVVVSTQGYRIVTGDDSTSFSTGMTYMNGKIMQSMTGIIAAFKEQPAGVVEIGQECFFQAQATVITRSLPGPPLVDDIVLVGITSDNAFTSGEGIDTTGYTDIGTSGTAGATPAYRLSYKRMVTPDTTVIIDAPAASIVAGVIKVFRGVDTTTALDNTSTTATGATLDPDPPSLTTVTADAMRVIVGIVDDDTGVACVAPGEFTTAWSGTNVTGTTVGAMMMMGCKIATSIGAENPGAFVVDTDDVWEAWHIAWRPAATSSPQDIDGALFTDTDTFYASTITRGPVSVTGALFTDTDTFFASTLTATYSITGALFTESDTFYGATFTPGAVSVTGALFTDADTFFAATINRGAVSVTGALFTDSDTFFGATFTAGVATISGALFTESDTFFASTLTAGPVTVTGALFTDADTFFQATLSVGAVTVSGALFTENDTFFASTITSAYTITGSLFTDADTFFASTFTTGPVTITGALFSEPDTFFAATLTLGSGPQTITGDLFSETDTFFSATLSSTYQVTSSRYDDPDTFFASAFSAGGVDVVGGLYEEPDTFFAATFSQDGGAPLDTGITWLTITSPRRRG